MYSGQEAIDYLAIEARADDPKASSHWRQFHSDFIFTGESFSGLVGFGGNASDSSRLKRLYTSFLQRPFRNMGKKYQSFESLERVAKAITKSQKREYDLDVMRQVITLSFLQANSPSSFTKKNMCAVIGDGFASLTSILIATEFVKRVALINLTKTLLVDLWYLKLWMGEEKFFNEVCLVTNQKELEDALNMRSSTKVIAFQAKNHQLLRECPIDIAINVVSMQEMNPSDINEYFSDLRTIASKRKLLFYCCNRLEKELPDGVYTRFDDYPWHDDDLIHINEICPWHEYFYSTKPPFYRRYDGPHMHRLTTLK